MRPVVIEYDAEAPEQVRVAAKCAGSMLAGILPGVDVIVRPIRDVDYDDGLLDIEVTGETGRVVRRG